MAKKLELCDEDEQELSRIRKLLISLRQKSGFSHGRLALNAGHSEKWLFELEAGEGHFRLSSLQDWAGCFDLRIHPNLELPDFAGFEVPHEIDTELQWLWGMAKQFDAASWVRAWSVAELRWERHWRGISAAQLGRDMGLSVSAVSAWERDGSDPMVSRLMTYARALGGRMTFELIKRRDWTKE